MSTTGGGRAATAALDRPPSLRRRHSRSGSKGSTRDSPDRQPGTPRSTGAQGGPASSLLINQKDRYRSFRVRFASSIVLIGSFLAIIYAGHVPLMFMILGIQTMMVKELYALATHAQRLRKPAGFTDRRILPWYFFAVAAFWMYIRFIKSNLIVEITSSARLARMFGWLLKRHTIISFYLYVVGFVSFVLTLKKSLYVYQFGQYAWTHMILMVVFVPSSFFVSNVFEGMIWFLLPCALVIINDIAAYLAGFFFGRTPLIKLSPKKTWEGFVGGCLGTVAVSWYVAGIMSRFKWLTCPRTDLSIWQPMECTQVPDTYQPQLIKLSDVQAELPDLVNELLGVVGSQLPAGWARAIAGFSFTARPMQIHAVFLSVFASIIAPFGGYFASGFKRGFKIKDFGDSIPGHGGMTDRMDCQVVMAVFSYIYYHSYVARAGTTVAQVMDVAMKLAPLQQLEVLERVSNLLVGQQYLPQSLADALASHARRALQER